MSSPKTRGRSIPVSHARQFIIDLMYFSKRVPSIPVQRTMNLAKTKLARNCASNKPSWVVLFVKAYAQVCSEYPSLRRAYLTFPWQRFYEHPFSVASIAVERQVDGEPAVMHTHLRDPLSDSLGDLDANLTTVRQQPVEEMRAYKMTRRLSVLPTFMRRFVWWIGLDCWGRRRAKEFGTFGVSVYSSLGAESLHPMAPLTSTLNYGPIAKDGTVNVRVVYDHRVLDGATVARALARLEEVLNTDIVEELRSLPQGQTNVEARAA